MTPPPEDHAEPRIVKREGFDLIGLEGRSSKANNRIPALWEQFSPMEDDIDHRDDLDVLYGACIMDGDAEHAEVDKDVDFTVLIGAQVSKVGEVPAGMAHRAIPGGMYAVFTHQGPFFPDGIHKTYEHIYREWMPKSIYKPAANYDFEQYDRRFRGVQHPATIIEIWVPVKYRG